MSKDLEERFDIEIEGVKLSICNINDNYYIGVEDDTSIRIDRVYSMANSNLLNSDKLKEALEGYYYLQGILKYIKK